MKINFKCTVILVACFAFANTYAQTSEQPVNLSAETIMEYWHSGKTLPVEMTRSYPWPRLRMREDTGINVLIDLAHQCTFVNLWDMPRNLQNMGYRAVGSKASLNTVLETGGKSRIRAYYDNENRIYPFAWWDNPEFNIIITEQNSSDSQQYTDDEIDAVEQFVANGGGLIIMASPQNAEVMQTWSINKLARRFGATFSANTDVIQNVRFAVIEGENITPLKKGDNNQTIAGVVRYKEGYVALIGHPSIFKYNNRDTEEKIAETQAFVSQILQEVSKGKKPINCSASFPITMGGGGAIYPELEQQMGVIVLYYAANQREDLLRCVRDYVPIAMRKVEEWLPSKPTDEPMYLILAAGGGGGWAVNAFRPKENGIISLDTLGVLSIFAHELAHTMGGPRNAKGEIAGMPPIPNQGEAHAGWFQGKVDAYFNPSLREQSNRNCNRIVFEREGVLTGLDLSIHHETEEGRRLFGNGTYWHKIWYIWQKLDDRYGTTWYPRWKWVQHTRWADTPTKRLSMDEMIEDMSIAVGEDLFPLFVKLGTTTEKQRLERIEFNGNQIVLPIAPIDITPAGNVKLDVAGDYKVKL